ncbi:MAG: hypothetical protein GEV09_01370 [Pseudonocardiaceae bacterium]|nr:hypothetical protein [Pseudonocardiaceae bacterium]
MHAVRTVGVVVFAALALAGCSNASAPSAVPAPVAMQPPPAPALEPQRVELGEQFEIIDEVGTVIATAAFTSLELDPECNSDYGGEPPDTGHYMFVGMKVETTVDYYGEGSFTYPSAHDFDVVPTDGPTEGDVYPMAGGDLCLPDDKEAFGFSTWTANGEYEGWIVVETEHAAGDLMLLPHFFTHSAGWKIAYPVAPPATVEETTQAASPAASESPSDHCDDPDWWNSRQSGDPGDYVAACGEYPYWLPDPNDETDVGVQDPCLGPNADVEACSDGYSDDSEKPNYLGPNENTTEDGYGSEWTRDQACAAEAISPEEC